MSDNNHGGVRPGSGRPTTDRKCQINARVSLEAFEIYQSWANKSEKLDNLIKQNGSGN